MDGMLFLLQILGMQKHYGWCFFLLLMGMTAITEASAPDQAGQEAAGIVAGLQSGAGGRLIYNEKTDRLEVRDEQGSLVDEIALGTAGKAVDVAGQEYRLSFGKDEMARRSVLVRAGPAMQKPITLEVLGRKAVLSLKLRYWLRWDRRSRCFMNHRSVVRCIILKVSVEWAIG